MGYHPDNTRRPNKGSKPSKGRIRKDDKKWRQQKVREPESGIEELLAEIGIIICPQCTAQYPRDMGSCPMCS
jgi:hypothetical protein